MFPKLYIGDQTPEGWGDSFPVRVLYNVRDFRDFVASYCKVKQKLEIGIDLRTIRMQSLLPLLKLMEDSNLRLHIRVREPVLNTILSRAMMVYKMEKIEKKHLFDCLVGDETIIGQKIRGLL